MQALSDRETLLERRQYTHEQVTLWDKYNIPLTPLGKMIIIFTKGFM